MIGRRALAGAGSLAPFIDRSPADSPASPPPPRLPPLRLLVAEDNAMNRDVMEQVLRIMGHDVVLASDGAEAVSLLQQGPAFDAVLLDLQMPVMDGLTAARAIRALPGNAARTRLLAVTADAMPSDRASCLAAGIDGFLAKPVTIARLTGALGELMTGTPAVHALADPQAGSIDAVHRQSLATALRPGSLERLVASFWAEIGDDIAALAPAGDAAQRQDRLHRLAGAAAMLGYAELAGVARRMGGDAAPDDTGLHAALRAALSADAALLPAKALAAARAALA